MLIRIERLKVKNYAFKGGLYLTYLQIYTFRKIMGPLVIQNLTQIKLCLENNRLLKPIYFHCIMEGQRLITLLSGKTGSGFESDYLNHLFFLPLPALLFYCLHSWKLKNYPVRKNKKKKKNLNNKQKPVSCSFNIIIPESIRFL